MGTGFVCRVLVICEVGLCGFLPVLSLPGRKKPKNWWRYTLLKIRNRRLERKKNQGQTDRVERKRPDYRLIDKPPHENTQKHLSLYIDYVRSSRSAYSYWFCLQFIACPCGFCKKWPVTTRLTGQTSENGRKQWPTQRRKNDKEKMKNQNRRNRTIEN